MEGLHHGNDNKFISRINFSQNKQDMLNLKHEGDNATEISLRTSTLQESTVMEIPVGNSSIMSLSPELRFGKSKGSKWRNASQPRGTALSN